MEFDYQKERPYVRVGMIQNDPEASFEAHVPFGVFNMEGEEIFRGEPGREYSVTILDSKPARIQPMIRLAICYDIEEAEQKIQEWEPYHLNLHIIRVGENVQIGRNEYLDNREYWVLAMGFASESEAEEQRRKLPDFGSYQIVQVPEVPPEGKIKLGEHTLVNGVRLVPQEDANPTFTLHNVRVGIGFHWDHRENQHLEGILEFHIDKLGKLTAVNVVDIEHYLAGVNSSEMTPDCHLEFLKAQTVVARCTVFATAGKHHYGDPFDVCGDDHCQRYWGAGPVQPRSLQAAQETEGRLLLYENRVCDTRYAKVCGGIAEAYRNVWDDRDVPYLSVFYDGPKQGKAFQTAETEEKAQPFIHSSPDVFCNPEVHKMPQYLDYAHQYFRWKVEYDPVELGKIVAEKLGRDLGAIRDILPIKRGPSGRLIYARVVGEKDEIVLGKELEIRRVLSTSHLYSSCFYVEKKTDRHGKTTQLVLHGGGWGHGVGLCQVGAAVMAEEGYTCEEILDHYYRGAEYRKVY